MLKKIKSYIKLQIPAKMANPSPPIGPSLGQHGVNISEFCKLFNEKTSTLEKGLLVPVLISVYFDRTFTFILKTTPTSVLLKQFMKIKLGSYNSKEKKVGLISLDKIRKIAQIKLVDMTCVNLEKAMKCIIGTAKSIGLNIEDKNVKINKA